MTPPRLPQLPFHQSWDEGAQVAIDTAARQRVHHLVAVSLTTSSPILGTPVLSQNAPAGIDIAGLPHEILIVGLILFVLAPLPNLQELRWWLIACLIYKLLNSAIANQSHLNLECRVKEFAVKLTLTPPKKPE